MTKQQLHCTQVLRPPVDQRCLRAARGVGPVAPAIKAGFSDPSLDDSGVLACRQMRREPQPTWEQIILGLEGRMPNPSKDRFAGRLRDLELHRPLSLLLHDNRASGDSIAVRNIADT